MVQLSRQDIESARHLPDGFRTLQGDPGERVRALVGYCWGQYPDGERRKVEQMLVGILEPLMDSSATLTDFIRDRCTATIQLWLERQKER